MEEPQSLGSVLARYTTQPRRQQAISDAETSLAQWADRAWSTLVMRIGERYADCTLDNFAISDDPETGGRQRRVINALRIHVASKEFGHRNIVFFGPKGTGKDHLMAAAMRTALAAGTGVGWINGLALCAKSREIIETGEPEWVFVRKYTEPQVLAISDPLPPSGALSDWEMRLLFQVIDGRYRANKATWVTINVNDATEADKRLGPQIADRLRDGMLSLRCSWPSYRRPGV